MKPSAVQLARPMVPPGLQTRTSSLAALSWSAVNLIVLLYALVPVLWIASLSFKPPGTIQDGRFIPQQWTLDNYRGIFRTDAFTSALINSIGIGLIATVIAVILGTMAAYAIARLDFPGKKILVGVALLIAMFPQISLVSPLFEIMRRRLTLTGSTLRPRDTAFKSLVADELARTVWPHVEAGKLKPVIDRVFAFADAPAAHARM